MSDRDTVVRSVSASAVASRTACCRRRLTLTTLQGSCKWSVGLYAGVWKREKT
jgi:hypothetical protein